MIYFIQAGNPGTIYITELTKKMTIKQKIKKLQYGCPYQLRIIAKITSTVYTAYMIRRKFNSIKTFGKWFKATKELVNFINNLKNNRDFEYRKLKTSKLWSDEMVEILKERYDKDTWNNLTATLGLTQAQIKKKAVALGLKRGYALRFKNFHKD